ncbi:hypothetical protein G6F43_004726 [Rhizopus delemar]|nr:hypothetical protein G6F43_004726 [Rhizopus delemar]
MNSFIQEDGMRSMFDEEGYQFVDIKREVDEVNYPLGNVTNFDQYSDLKSPEKMQQDKKEVPEEELSSSEKKRAAKRCTESTRKRIWKSFATCKGAVKMGRPALLNDIHKDYLISLVNVKPSIVLDGMMGSLTTEFADLKISKSSLHEFVTEKQGYLPYQHEALYDMVKKGERAVVIMPKTKAKITTIIGATSPYGVVNIKVKSLKVAGPSNKQKAAPGGSVVVGKGKGGTVTGHYFNFIAMTLDVMDKHELFKGHYLVMDNAPIHKHTNIRSYIESRRYGWAYLPPYSSELNPIELFWSVCKSKLKREALLEEKTLTSRIKVACNNVLISNLCGFFKYSVAKFSDCLEKRPI